LNEIFSKNLRGALAPLPPLATPMYSYLIAMWLVVVKDYIGNLRGLQIHNKELLVAGRGARRQHYAQLDTNN